MAETLESVQPLAIAERVERIELKQWQRRYAQDGRQFSNKRRRRLSGGLDTHFLSLAFGWLLDDRPDPAVHSDDMASHWRLVKALWAQQAWWLSGSGRDDDDDYQPMQEFGYAILDELAWLIHESPTAAGPELWQPVFALGPKGHYAVGHFLLAWFMLIAENTDVTAFGPRWRLMIEAMVLDEAWAKGRPWYYGQQLERQVLGFGASDLIQRATGAATLIESMRDLYASWAKKRLTGDEDNLCGFCGFIATAVAKHLRLDGLRWINEAIKAEANVGKWFRDRTSNAFVEFLDVLVSEHVAELSKDEKSLQALLDLAAHAVARNLTAAQALQERIVKLF